MNLAEDLIVSVVARVLDRRQRELKVLDRDLSKLESVQKPFPRMSYDEAVAALQARGLPITWGGDFGGPDETMLSEQYDRPVMVHRYPSAVEGLLHEAGSRRPELALGVDIPGARGYGEIVGGGERLADLDLLLQRIREHDLPQEAFEWYRRSPQIRYRAPWRFRHGYRARRRVDLQARTRPETIPYPRIALPVVPA